MDQETYHRLFFPQRLEAEVEPTLDAHEARFDLDDQPRQPVDSRWFERRLLAIQEGTPVMSNTQIKARLTLAPARGWECVDHRLA